MIQWLLLNLRGWHKLDSCVNCYREYDRTHCEHDKKKYFTMWYWIDKATSGKWNKIGWNDDGLWVTHIHTSHINELKSFTFTKYHITQNPHSCLGVVSTSNTDYTTRINFHVTFLSFRLNENCLFGVWLMYIDQKWSDLNIRITLGTHSIWFTYKLNRIDNKMRLTLIKAVKSYQYCESAFVGLSFFNRIHVVHQWCWQMSSNIFDYCVASWGSVSMWVKWEKLIIKKVWVQWILFINICNHAFRLYVSAKKRECFLLFHSILIIIN